MFLYMPIKELKSIGVYGHVTPTEFKNIRKSKAINIPPLTGLVQ